MSQEEQSDKYKKLNDIDYIANFPGARVAKDAVAVLVDGGIVDIGDNPLRQLGVVSVNSLPDSFDVGIESGQVIGVTQEENFTVTDDGDMTVTLGETAEVRQIDGGEFIVQENNPLDVSGAEVDVDINSQSLTPITVTDDGNLAVAAWNAGTLPVQEDTPLNVSAATVTIQEDNPVDVNVNSPPETKTTENYGVDVETDYTATLNVGDYSHVGISINIDSNTDILVERSWDQNTWFEVESASSAGKLNQNVQGASGTYYRVTITGTGTTGDTADVVISAKSM